MKIHEATEQAYKNGYEDGKRDAENEIRILKQKRANIFEIANAYERGMAAAVKHGRWVFGTSNKHEWMKCSECLKSQTPNGCFAYCPNCGAKMALPEPPKGE